MCIRDSPLPPTPLPVAMPTNGLGPPAWPGSCALQVARRGHYPGHRAAELTSGLWGQEVQRSFRGM
eukprot:6480777-Alexandrium_andersonii.AAC.1